MTPEEKKAYMKEWRQKNKEKLKSYDKSYRENNKEKIKQKDKEYRKTPAFHKSTTISDWKRRGLIHDDYDGLYNSYLQATHCDFCKNEFKDTFDRCMDHNHQTGLFRAFLCRSCNICDVFKHQTSS